MDFEEFCFKIVTGIAMITIVVICVFTCLFFGLAIGEILS